jgi:hypothetical protein
VAIARSGAGGHQALCHPERPRGISCEGRVAGLASGTVGRAIPTATQNPQARWSAQRRRPQKNCSCYHRGGTQRTGSTASPCIQNRGCERKRPETSDRADRPNDGTVGRATSRDLKGNGLRDAVVSRGRSPFSTGPGSRSIRVEMGSGPVSRFRPISSHSGFWMPCRSGSCGWSPKQPSTLNSRCRGRCSFCVLLRCGREAPACEFCVAVGPRDSTRGHGGNRAAPSSVPPFVMWLGRRTHRA